MSHKTKQDIKDFLSIAIGTLTFASIIFYGGQLVQRVDDQERRITILENFQREINRYKIEFNK